MDKGIEYIRAKLPAAFLFENVKALTFKMHRPYFDSVISALKGVQHGGEPAYEVTWKVMNTKDYGLPQSRPRVFVVGVRRSRMVRCFKWPKKVKCTSIENILGPRSRKLATHPNLSNFTATQVANFTAGLNKIIAKGGDPISETWFIDLNSSPSRRHVVKDICPCLTKSRAVCKGYYVSNRGRFMNTSEMLALQGVPRDRLIRPTFVREHKFDASIGNAVSIPVLRVLLHQMCVALGYADL